MRRGVRWSGGNESFIREFSRESEKNKDEMVIQVPLEEFDYKKETETRKDVGSRENFLVVFNMGEEVYLYANGIIQ